VVLKMRGLKSFGAGIAEVSLEFHLSGMAWNSRHALIFRSMTSQQDLEGRADFEGPLTIHKARLIHLQAC